MNHSKKQNRRSFATRVRRGILTLVALISVALLGWVGYINLPRPDFEVSQIARSGQHPTSFRQTTQTDPKQKPGSPSVQQKQPQPSATKKSELPFNVSLVYSPGYLIDLGGLERLHPFDIQKYKKIHEQLKSDGLITDDTTLKPELISDEDLLLVHSQAYLDKLKKRKNVAYYLEAAPLQYAPINLEQSVLQPFKRATGGTLLAARESLVHGIGINMGGGYHHAKPDSGEGFCLYADVPIAIRKLQKEKLINRAVVIDVDVHQGNGTIVCLKDDKTTFTFSMHQGDIYPIPKEIGDFDVELDAGMKDAEYLEVLKEHLPKILDLAKADICFIVGGCDTLAGDPLASLRMTADGIVKRDNMIVQACVDRKIPVVLTLSGGYSANAWKSQYQSIKNLIQTRSLAKR